MTIIRRRVDDDNTGLRAVCSCAYAGSENRVSLTWRARSDPPETEDQAMTEENVEVAADEQIDLKSYVSPPALSFTVTIAIDKGLL